MNIEKHVTSLELSQKLKAAGFRQDWTLFVWVECLVGVNKWGWVCITRELYESEYSAFDFCAAPIATEIPDIENINLWDKNGNLANKIQIIVTADDLTAADCLAKMWLEKYSKGLTP